MLRAGYKTIISASTKTVKSLTGGDYFQGIMEDIMGKQKVVLFCRSATTPQLAYQQERLKEYADANNCEVVAIVMDRRNGATARRWKLNLAMRIACKRSAGILVTDISKVSRNPIMSVKFARQLHRQKIELFTTVDGVEKDQVETILLYSKFAGLESYPKLSMT